MQHFTIKLADGVVATSYNKGDKFFIDPQKLLPLERFLPRPKAPGDARAGAVPLRQRDLCAVMQPGRCMPASAHADRQKGGRGMAETGLTGLVRF